MADIAISGVNSFTCASITYAYIHIIDEVENIKVF